MTTVAHDRHARRPRPRATTARFIREVHLLDRSQDHRDPVPAHEPVLPARRRAAGDADPLAARVPGPADAGRRRASRDDGAGRHHPARVLQRARHHARHVHGVLRDHAAAGGRVRELPDPAQDRRATTWRSRASTWRRSGSAVPAGILMLASFFVEGGAAGAGWTGYAPLSASPEYTGVHHGPAALVPQPHHPRALVDPGRRSTTSRP